MFNYEYNLIQQRLSAKRGHESRFFVFADTVAAQSFRGTSECHGWIGIKFQKSPLGPANEIIIHVRMLDKSNVQQQEALGFVGVNLIYAAFYCQDPAVNFVPALIENLSSDRIEIDMIEIKGPDYPDIDNRLLSLQLVQLGLSNAAMFSPSGEVMQPSEVLYGKAVLVERGSFRPVTNVHLDMLEASRQIFMKDSVRSGRDSITLAELTLTNLMSTGTIDMNDFLARVDTVSALGLTVLISNYPQFYRLVAFLRRYTKEPIGLALGVNTLLEVFNEKYYENLEGGILEALGRLFKHNVQLFVYPMSYQTFQEFVKMFNPPHDSSRLKEGELITADNLPIMAHLQTLHSYLKEQQAIISLDNYKPELLNVMSKDILNKIARNDPSWEAFVPKTAAELIRKRKLLRYGEDAD